jgi:hypothetical protein
MALDIMRTGYALVLIAFLAVSAVALWATMAQAEARRDRRQARNDNSAEIAPTPVQRVNPGD